jgi:hypothetical protein
MYLIRQRNSMTYYSDILDSKHCVYGFRHKIHAVRCTQFLREFRQRYNRYPSPEQVMMSPKFITEPDQIYVDCSHIDEMKIKCVVNGMHLFEVHDFGYETSGVNRREVIIRGENVTDGIEVLHEHRCSHLNNILEL